MSTTPTEAHRKLAEEITGCRNGQHPEVIAAAAQLLADNEARAVDAALHGASVDGLTLCGCKDHPHRKDLSCCKIRRSDGTPLTVAETFAAITAARERVRVLREALEFLLIGYEGHYETGKCDTNCAVQARSALATTAEQQKDWEAKVAFHASLIEEMKP